MRKMFVCMYLVVAAGLAPAQESLAGKVVILKRSGLTISQFEAGGEPIPVAVLDEINFRVRADKDGWLLLVNYHGIEGWLPKAEVLPIADAVAYFTAQIEKNPKSADAFARRAASLQLQGRLDEAFKDIVELLRLEPRGPAWWNNRGNASLVKGNVDDALSEYQKAVELDPKFAKAYYNRALAHRRLGNIDKALADFDQVLRLEPRFVHAHVARGAAYQLKRDYEKALQCYDEAVRLDPKDAYTIGSRGNARIYQRDYDGALEDLNRAIEIEPALAWLHGDRAKAWAGKKRFAKARSDFEKSLELNPKQEWTLNAFAWLLATCPNAAIRDGRRAVQAARKALELTQGKHANVLETLAAALAEEGSFDEAIERQTEALADAVYARTSGEPARRRLELYRKNLPFRQE